MYELEEEMLAFEDAVHRYRHAIPKRFFWRETSAQHFNTLSGAFPIPLPHRSLPGTIQTPV
jgi:hypothetical protein